MGDSDYGDGNTERAGEVLTAQRQAATRGQLSIEHLSHGFDTPEGRLEVLDDVSFEVPSGTVASVVGPSGCGKSTLLSVGAGLIAPSSGRILWDGMPVARGRNKDMAMAFQSPGLFPWMTVEKNVMVGLRTRGATKAEAQQRAIDMLETVGLTDFRKAYPSQLSGGMAQRVGIARALALRPRLLLMDEPFGAVDAFTRLKLQREFISLLRIAKPTVLFVTHDVPEAILLGDIVVVMSSRPASVKSVTTIDDRDRDRSSPHYAEKLSAILADLGVPPDVDHH